MTVGIYQIINIANNNCYIGSSAQSIEKRFRYHKYQLTKNKHHSYRLQADWHKYDPINFKLQILVECNPIDCILIEQSYIDRYKPYYNINPTAGSTLGRPLSAAGKEKLSRYWKGRIFNIEHRHKLSLAGQGHEMSAESRLKLSLSMMGRSPNITSFKKGHKPWITGKSHTELSKLKISLVKKSKNKHLTDDHKQKISNFQTGKVLSEETKQKMSEAKKLYWQSIKKAVSFN